jgi:hypothetical protein
MGLIWNFLILLAWIVKESGSFTIIYSNLREFE